MDQEHLQNLIEVYRTGSSKFSEKEKAQAEEDLWHTALGIKATKPKVERRDWLNSEFGGGPAVYESRCVLLKAKNIADPLWALIDLGVIKIAKAQVLLRDARQKALKESITIPEALDLILRGVDPTFSKPAPIPASPIKLEEALGDKTRINQSIRSLVEGYSTIRLKGVDVYLAKQAKERLLWWIDDALEQFGSEVAKLRSGVRQELFAVIGKNQFENACLKLGIKAQWKKPLNLDYVLKAAKRRRYELHPDRNKGVDTKAEFDAVTTALEILTRYCEGT